MLNDIFKSIGPIIAGAMADSFERGEVRFESGKFPFDGGWDGVLLDELDLTQPAPEKILLLGPATVRITKGKTFRITAEGDGAATIRFSLRDGRLAIASRSPREGSSDPGVVDITMPAPRALAVTGSGSIETNTLAHDAKVGVAGSGSIALDGIACKRLKANLMGSGRLRASGAVDRLKLASAGSGVAELPHLAAATANLCVTGSGSVRLSSDGNVEAQIMGSGGITIFGRARCQVKSLGSGTFNCILRPDRDDEPDAQAPPGPPKAPKSSGAGAKPAKAKNARKAAKTRKASTQ